MPPKYWFKGGFVTIEQDEEGFFKLYWSDWDKIVIIGVGNLVKLIDNWYATKKITQEDYNEIIARLVAQDI